jgi:hypothetical protein
MRYWFFWSSPSVTQHWSNQRHCVNTPASWFAPDIFLDLLSSHPNSRKLTRETSGISLCCHRTVTSYSNPPHQGAVGTPNKADIGECPRSWNWHSAKLWSGLLIDLAAAVDWHSAGRDFKISSHIIHDRCCVSDGLPLIHTGGVIIGSIVAHDYVTWSTLELQHFTICCHFETFSGCSANVE